MGDQHLGARGLVEAYSQSLRRQIQTRGSNLACSDEELCVLVKAQLRDEPLGTHCLGLDPLRTMEESLQEVSARRGLRTLEGAFQVLEQAALNLYIAPWRAEYAAVKMYSGVFTHVVKAALSAAQIQRLFGLLGYEAEQQQLSRVRRAPSEDLLRLSCAFFLARCECRLLLEALGSHGGDAMWQLGIVRERRRGRTLQASLDSTRSTLADAGDSDLDLYTDPALNGDHLSVPTEAWEAISTAGGQGSAPSSPQLCVSTLSYQLTAPPSLSPRGGVSPESRTESGGGALGEAACSCLQTPVSLRECVDCGQLHDTRCAVLGRCASRGHLLLTPRRPTDPQTQQRPRECDPSTHSAALSSLTLSDARPISFHSCCAAAGLEPRYMCASCRAFHCRPCPQLGLCLDQHQVQSLGSCGCGKTCSRRPLVLCVYCGAEYCSDCWYKDPLSCVCGRPLDPPSSSV
ncbi:spermatogenesis associated 2-like [Synchiropus splendidus]|uniref:spermatogenesis associated 2-like n=1 Tax=Synchiropus splendidus TaxID=270530 RepID=UPI00237DCD24|nr:spermatogenesis associated 2-like [Synchiropus splendidus]XP_053742093.1 spermatogenesis associated 2-like [Synchiropus splendidus]XP_053742094.1 spermatogenesis associated 2-like [Synchiropus splendidus]